MSENAKLTKKDFVSDQDVKWCPGCGDHAAFNSMTSAFAELGLPKEDIVIIFM